MNLRKLLIGDFTWKRMIKSIVFIYLAFAIYIFFFSDSMIFLPQPSSYQDSPEIIKITSTDGIKISSLYLTNPKAKYTILYAHGNAEDLEDIRPNLEKLRNIGFNIFAYDYRGYGTSQGRPTEKNAYKDIDTAYKYLTEELQISPRYIIAFGRSVGGGSAVDLALRKPVAGLVAETTFISAFRVVIPFPILPFDKFKNIEKITKIKCPVLVMHGTADDVIPFYHGEKLFAAAPQPKLYLWVQGANHNNFDLVAGQKYEEILGQFIRILNKNEGISNM